MNLKKIFVMLFSLGLVAPIIPADFEGHGLDDEQVAAYETYRKHCKEFKSIKVCGNATIGGSETVGGNLTVTGTVTAGSFALSPAAAAGTPGLPGVGGLLAWGEVGNLSTGVTAVGAGVVPMTYTSTALSGMTAGTNGLVVTNAGIYLAQYSITQAVAGGAAADVQLFVNSGAVVNSTYTVTTTAGAVAEASGAILTLLPAGALVQLNSTTGFSTPASGSIAAKLVLTRIS